MGKGRLQQLVKWVGGPDFDGPIIFDERSVHNNAVTLVMVNVTFSSHQTHVHLQFITVTRPSTSAARRARPQGYEGSFAYPLALLLILKAIECPLFVLQVAACVLELQQTLPNARM